MSEIRKSVYMCKSVVGVLLLGLVLSVSVPTEEVRASRVGVKEFEVKNNIGWTMPRRSFLRCSFQNSRRRESTS